MRVTPFLSGAPPPNPPLQLNDFQNKDFPILTGKEFSKHTTLKELKTDALLEIVELQKK